jgi:2-aminoadipate transaminase
MSQPKELRGVTAKRARITMISSTNKSDMPLYSTYGLASRLPAPVNRMMAAFAADFRDAVDINLGVGYVSENTMPIDAIRAAMEHVFANPVEYRQPLNYGGPAGSEQLIEAIARFQQRTGGLTEAVLARNRIIVGASGATSLLEALADAIEPGVVLTADPMYYIYCDYLQRKGHEVVAVPEDAQGFDPDVLEQAIQALGERREQIRFIYAVTVNNPSGIILPYARRRALLEIARRLSEEQGRPVPLVLDRAYEWLTHDPAAEQPRSLLPEDDTGLVLEVDTLSKIFAPALRVGYLMGRDSDLLRIMVQKTSDTGFSAPLLNQYIAARLLDEEAGSQLARVNAGYREKAAIVGEALRRQLGPWIETMSGGQAGFYYYLTLRGIETHEDAPFFRFLARTTGDIAADGPPEARRPRVIYIPVAT